MPMTSQRGRILVLDDEKNIVIVLCAILEKRGFTVDSFTDAKKALESLGVVSYDAAITDLFMPELDGISFLKQAKQIQPDLPVIVITAFGAVETAVDAIKSGAFDYVTKPFEQSEISAVVEKAVNTRRLAHFELLPGGATDVAQDRPLSSLLYGEDESTQELLQWVERVADSPSSILILGEPGTGKEILVEDIHRRSRRAQASLVKLNCAAIPEQNLGVEIFGSESRPGKLKLADHGTLFLDEITEMPWPEQIRLAAFLESGELELTSGKRLRLDVRIIAAANGALEDAVRNGTFREDLFYKLNVVPLYLPSLRNRVKDFSRIAEYFIQRLSQRLHKNVTGIEEDCLQELKKYSWPGNLRQLENVLERMILLADAPGSLRQKHISENLHLTANTTEAGVERFRQIVKKRTQDLERDLIERALKNTGENVTRAAEHLGISRKGLQLKMKELGIR